MTPTLAELRTLLTARGYVPAIYVGTTEIWHHPDRPAVSLPRYECPPSSPRAADEARRLAEIREELDRIETEVLAALVHRARKLRGRAAACQAHAERALEQLLRRQGRLRQEKTDDP